MFLKNRGLLFALNFFCTLTNEIRHGILTVAFMLAAQFTHLPQKLRATGLGNLHVNRQAIFVSIPIELRSRPQVKLPCQGSRHSSGQVRAESGYHDGVQSK